MAGKNKKLPLQTPETQELLRLINEGLTSGEGPFSDIFGKFNEEEFQKGVAQPAIEDYKQNILPQLQEQFIANNQVMGSGMQQGVAKSGNALQAKLAELMYQAKQQHKQNKLAGAGLSIGAKPHENLYEQGDKSSIWDKILPVVGGAAGGFLAGGPAGAAVGGASALAKGATVSAKAGGV